MAKTEKYKLGDPRANNPPDNEMLHYGTGLVGSACMCQDPNRKETWKLELVTCPECAKIKGKQMKPREGDAMRQPLPDDMGA